MMTIMAKTTPKEFTFQIPFPDMYDLKTVPPFPEHEALPLRAKDRLAGIGVPYD